MITYLENILISLDIKNYQDISIQLFIKYENLYQIFTGKAEETFNIKNEIIDEISSKTYDDNNSTVILFSLNNYNLIFFILKDNHVGYLISLSSNIILFNLVMKIIDNYPVEYIFFNDTLTHIVYNSPTKLDSLVKNTKDIPIYDLSLLTTGNPFFEDYDLIPYKSKDHSRNDYAIIHNNCNINLVNCITVKDTNIYEYLVKASFRLDLNKIYSKKILKDIVAKYNDSSVVEFMNYFFMNHDTDLKLFNEIYDDVMKDLGIVSLSFTEYYKKI